MEGEGKGGRRNKGQKEEKRKKRGVAGAKKVEGEGPAGSLTN